MSEHRPDRIYSVRSSGTNGVITASQMGVSGGERGQDVASGWLELPTLLRKWLASEIESQRIQNKESKKEGPGAFDLELFQEQVRPGHSVLMGKFRVGNEVIQVTHSQWEGDSYLLSLQQRKQILRMTVLERVKKSPTAGSA